VDFVRDNPGEPVPQKVHFAIFWIFWSKMKITQQMHQQSGWTATPSRVIVKNPQQIKPMEFEPLPAKSYN